jgi:hypothetical protein
MDRSLYNPSPWHRVYHQSTCDWVMGGGSAGPGKSLGLLWDPIVTQAVIEHARMTQRPLEGFPPWLTDLCLKHPIKPGESEGHALHMRRTMPQLRETLDRAHRMFVKFDPHVEFSKENHRYTFSSGYKYTFGHCRQENDYEDYLSQQYTWLGLDEAYQFTLKQFEELDARVRSADPVLVKLLRTRLMSNPAPGWLKETFVDPAPEGNVILRKKITDPATGQSKHKTILFLPAKLDDNPDKAFVESYKFKLLSKPAHIRARYLYGDWDSQEGGYFEDDFNPAVHVVEPYKIPRDWPKFRAMDWGYKAPGTIGWFALDPDENLILFHEFNFRLMTDAACADRVIEIEKKFGFWDPSERKSRLNGVADTQLWEKRGDSGRSKAQVFADKGIYWQPADKADMQRNAERLVTRLRDYDENSPPGLMVFNTCRETRKMLAGIQVDPNDSTVPDKNSPLKHWFDMVAYAGARASRGRGSIVMDLHEFDRRDEEEETVAPGGGFGYGVN